MARSITYTRARVKRSDSHISQQTNAMTNKKYILISFTIVAKWRSSESSKFLPRSHDFLQGRSLTPVFLKEISSIVDSTAPPIEIAGGSNSVSISRAQDSAVSEIESIENSVARDETVLNTPETKNEVDTDHGVINGTATMNGAYQDSPSSEGNKKKIFLRKTKKINSAAAVGKKLKNRNSMNIKRKLFHVGFGTFFAGLNHALPRKIFLPFMCFISTGTLLMETFRYRKGFEFLNKILHGILGSTLRKHEMEGKFTGSLYYFSGVALSTFLFPKTATTLGIFQLALADPAASYFGKKTRHVYWSRIENGFFGIGRNKGLLGFVGGALVCVPLNYRVLSVAKWGVSGPLGGKGAIALASLALGAAGSLADLAVPTPSVTLPSKHFPLSIDDNFVVPVLSGFACTKIFNHLRWSHDLELAKYIIF